MPKFVSVAGKWHPAKEVVQLPLTQDELIAGKNPVYIGPDRGALALMVEQGYATEDETGPIGYSGEDERFKGKRFKITDNPGRDCFTDPDVIRMARTLGYKTVAEYLDEMYGIKRSEIEAKAKMLLDIIQDPNKSSDRKPAQILPSGGDEDPRAGNRGKNDKKGGFDGDAHSITARA